MSSTPVVIRTRGLEKRYQETVAVRSLDLDIHQGEVFGLLGPNGAGKTTTILMLLGLTEPTSGTAEVLGLDPLRDPLHVKRHVGYLPDNVGFYGAMTGRENLRYTARLNGIPDKESNIRITELLEQVGLPEAGEAPVETYSRGMRQRLGLADVLVKDPFVIILDEPTTSIDPVGVVEVLDLVRSLARDHGVSVLLSSHLLHQVQQVCDRIAIFVAGDVVAMGTVAEIAAQQQRGALVAMDIGADGDQDVVSSILRGVPGVTGVAVDPQDRRLLTVTAPPEVRPAVLQALLSAGRTPWLVRDRGMELDEIYQQYFATGGGAAARVEVQGLSDIEATATLQLPETGPIPAGWRVIGAREFTEHLLSVRFIALLLVLGLAGILAIYAVAGSFRDVASQIPSTITGQKVPVFPLLFTTSPSIPGLTGQSFPSFAGLVALLGPVLGIAFGFDAISSERSEGTLPRLVSQPIHRDDVINGKFVAGLAVIAMILGAVVMLLSGVGIIRLGIVPDGDILLRVVTWFVVASLFVAFWLALATLASVVFRRAATAALVVIAVWLVLTFFGSQIVSLVANVVRPLPASPTADEQLGYARLVAELGRLSPITLFTEMTQALLNPLTQSLDPYFSDPTQRALPTILPYTQSLLLIWPQVVVLLAGTVICFAAAYVSFMRQEVRA